MKLQFIQQTHIEELLDSVGAGAQAQFPVRQPAVFANAIDWTAEYVIEYLPDTGGFKTGFVNFTHHEAG